MKINCQHHATSLQQQLVVSSVCRLQFLPCVSGTSDFNLRIPSTSVSGVVMMLSRVTWSNYRKPQRPSNSPLCLSSWVWTHWACSQLSATVEYLACWCDGNGDGDKESTWLASRQTGERVLSCNTERDAKCLRAAGQRTAAHQQYILFISWRWQWASTNKDL